MAKKSKKRKKSKTGLVQVVIGMVAAMMLLAIAFRILGGDAIAEKVEEELPQDHPELIQERDAADLEKHLNQMLDEMRSQPAKTRMEVKMELRRKIFECAQLLTEVADNDESRDNAAVQMMAAAQGISALQLGNPKIFDPSTIGELENTKTLKSLVKKYKSHPNPKVVQQAYSGRLLISVYEYTSHLRDRTADKESTAKHEVIAKTVFLETLEKYPEDLKILRPLKVSFQHLANKAPEMAQDLASTAFAKHSNSGPVLTQKYVRGLMDLMKLKAIDYEGLIRNRSFSNRGSQPLKDASLALLNDPEIGRTIQRQLISTSSWYESRSNLDSAREIYSAMVENSPNIKDEDVRKVLANIGKNGLLRLDLVGQPLTFSLTSTSGRKLDNEELKDKIVLLAFWSENSTNSIDMLKTLYNTKANIPADVVILPISTLQVKNEETLKLMEFYNDWDFVIGEDNDILKDFPLNFIPNIAVLDKDHRLVRLRVSLSNLPTYIKSLVVE